MREQNNKQLLIDKYLLNNNIKPIEDYVFNGDKLHADII